METITLTTKQVHQLERLAYLFQKVDIGDGLDENEYEEYKDLCTACSKYLPIDQP